jgi:hypothetical protein
MERKTILKQDAPISAHNMNTHAGCDLEKNDMTLLLATWKLFAFM